MQYLAMIRCNCDDIPIGLYPSRTDAVQALKRCTVDEIKRLESRDLFSMDITALVGGAVVAFDESGRVATIDNDAPVSVAVREYLGVNE